MSLRKKMSKFFLEKRSQQVLSSQLSKWLHSTFLFKSSIAHFTFGSGYFLEVQSWGDGFAAHKNPKCDESHVKHLIKTCSSKGRKHLKGCSAGAGQTFLDQQVCINAQIHRFRIYVYRIGTKGSLYISSPELYSANQDLGSSGCRPLRPFLIQNPNQHWLILWGLVVSCQIADVRCGNFYAT